MGKRLLLFLILQISLLSAFAQSPIFDAVNKNDTTALLNFLKTDANKAAVNEVSQGFMPIHFAARDGYTDITRILLSNGAKIDETGASADGKFTPLMLAVKNNQIGVIKLLLDHGASRKYKNEKGLSVDSFEAENKNFWTSLILKDPEGGWLRYQAYTYVLNKNYEACKQLIAKYGLKAVDGYDYGWYLIHYAARSGDLDFLTYLVKAGADINIKKADGATPLIIATINNLALLCDYLVKAGADITLKDNDGKNAIAWAKTLGSANLAEIMVDPDKGMETYKKDLRLFEAVGYNDILGADEALKAGANIEAIGKFHHTPLAAAIDKGMLNVGELLLKKGANPNKEFGHPSTRLTPLSWAANYGLNDFMFLLLRYGADTALAPTGGKKPLALAIEAKRYWAEQILLDTSTYFNWVLEGQLKNKKKPDKSYLDLHLKKGRNLDFQNQEGNTLLHLAAKAQNTAWINYLLKAGADTTLLNKTGAKAYDFIQRPYGQLFFTDPAKAMLYMQLFDAAETNDQVMLKKVLGNKLDLNMLNDNDLSALQLAIQYYANDVVKLLLEAGADPNFRTETNAVQMAALNSNYPAFLLLIEKGVKVDPDDVVQTNSYWIKSYMRNPQATQTSFKAHQILWAAAEKGDTTVLTADFLKKIDINALNPKGYSALHLAVLTGHLNVIIRLLALGANINIQTAVTGKTPVMLAGTAKQYAVVKYLLSNKADYKVIEDYAGKTFNDLSNDDIELARLYNEQAASNIISLAAQLFFQSAEDGKIDNYKLYEEYLPDVNITDSIGETLLYKALTYKQAEVADWLLAKGADVNKPSGKDGELPLMVAARLGDLKTVKKLTAKGAALNALDKNGNSAAKIALTNGYVLLSKYLNGDAKAGLSLEMVNAAKLKDTVAAIQFLKNGADPNARIQDSVSFTALHFAARGNLLNLVAALLKAGAHANAHATANDQTFTPIMLASYNNFFRTTDLLLQNGADPAWKNEKDSSAVSLAKKRSKYITMLFQDPVKARIKYNKEQLLIDLIKENDIRQAKELLDAGQDPNITDATGYTPLHYAINRRSEELAATLLAKGAKVNANDGTYAPLMLAVVNNDFAMASLLMENKALPALKNKQDSSALDLAKARKYEILVSLLNGNKFIKDFREAVNAVLSDSAGIFNAKIATGMDLNQQSDVGYTLLHYAARENRYDMAKKLLTLNANINIQGNDGYTPLMLAAKNNRWKIAYMLLINNAQTELKNTDGETAKNLAIINGNRLLGELFKKPDSVYNNLTMIDAVQNGNMEELQYLLRKGISVNFLDDINWPAISYAARNNQLEMIEVLLRNGANPNIIVNTDDGRYSPLMLAANNNNTEILKVLLDHQADAATVLDGRTALDIAIKGNTYWPTVVLKNETEGYQRFLLSKQLQQAIKNDDLISVKEAILLGASLKEPVYSAQKALFYAIYSGSLKVADYLARITEHLEEETWDGYTPLIAAVSNNYLKTAIQLVAYGAKINYTSKTGLSALTMARDKKNQQMLNMLQQPAEYNRQFTLLNLIDKDDISGIANMIKDKVPLNMDLAGDYPVIYAAKKKKAAIIALLLKAGAKPDVKDTTGKTALDYAVLLTEQDRVTTADGFNTDGFHTFSILAQAAHPPVTAFADHTLDWYNNYLKDPQAAVAFKRNEKLVAAIRDKDPEKAKTLLNEGANPNFYDSKGISLLSYIIAMKQDTMAMFLLDHGAKPLKFRSNLPMELAAVYGDTALINKLTISGFAINAADAAGKTVLEYAIEAPNVKNAVFLIKKGADPNKEDATGNTPLSFALRKNAYLEVIEALLKAGADPNQKPAKDLYYPLSLTSYDEIVQLLINYKADVNKIDGVGKTALHHAAQEQMSHTVSLLIKAGADLNQPVTAGTKRYTALMFAVEHDDMETALILQEAGADIYYKDSVGNSAYTIAKAAKNSRMIRFLADPVQAKLDYSLREAILGFNVKLTEEYLAKGADINVQNIDGNSILHTILRYYGDGKDEMIDLLLKHRSLLSIINYEGDSPLDIAIKRDFITIAKKMIAAGADPNLQNPDKRRPLELAVEQGDIRTAWTLIKAGADKDKKTILGETIADVAKKKDNKLMLDVLQEKTDPDKIRLFNDWQKIYDDVAPGDSSNNLRLSTAKQALEVAKTQGLAATNAYFDMYENYIYALAYNNYFTESLAAAEELTRILKDKGENNSRYRDSYLLQATLFNAAGNTKKTIELVKTAINLIPGKGMEKMTAYKTLAGFYEDSLATEYYKLALSQVSENDVSEDVLSLKADYAKNLIAVKDSTGIKLLYEVENTILSTKNGKTLLSDIYPSIVSYEHEHKHAEVAMAYLNKLMELPDASANYIAIGKVATLLKRYDKAEYYLKMASLRPINHRNAEYYLLCMYLQSRQEANAVKTALGLSNALIEETRQAFKFLSEEEKYNLLKAKKSYFDILYSTALLYPGNKDLIAMVTNNALFTKGALIRTTAGLNLVIHDTKDPVVNELYKKWKQIKSDLESQYTLKPEARTLDIEFLEEKVREYEKNLFRYSDVKDSLTTWQQVKAKLLPGEAAIEFITFEQYKDKWTDSVRIVALVITPEKATPQMIPLCFEEDLFKAVQKSDVEGDAIYVNRLYVARGIELLGKGGQENRSVYKLIWEPLEKTLVRKKQLYLSLSGSLHKLSFAALPFAKDSLLLDKYDIKYVNSAANLGSDNNRVSNKRSVALFGGIDYNIQPDSTVIAAVQPDTVLRNRSLTLTDARGGSWKYLPGTLTETEKINKLFKDNGWNANLYVAKEATEKRMKGLTGNAPSIIHIATHGYFFPSPEQKAETTAETQNNVFVGAQNPLMRTGLLLAGGNTSWQKGYTSSGTDDGILTAYEVANLNLSSTDLVVLSACETGLGDIRGSEGVYGLQRAFKIAGADKLIMSLWQVPDKETAELMQLFYGYLITEKNYHKAFNLAQKKMRQKYPPYFWAAFILVE